MKNLLLLFLLASLIAGCNSKAAVSEEETTSSELPWPISSPSQEGVDSLVLDSIHQDIEQGLYGLVDRFLVIRNGKITPKGEVDTEGGLYLSTYDMAKIGYLMMKGGQWEGQQIVSKAWVEQSLKPSVQFDERRGYGYQWWIPEHRDGQARIFAGNGYGGQFLMVVPEHELIVAFNGWQHHGRPERSTWRALEERILPGVAP